MENNIRKVAVTGMGVISPVGNNVEDFFSSLCRAQNGIGLITGFDTTEFRTKLAAEVKNFNPLEYMSKNEARHTALYAQYALSAAYQAIQDSRIADSRFKQRIGVCIGTGTGGGDTIFSETVKYTDKGPHFVSPFFVPMSISNMAGALIAIKYGFKGPNMPSVTACSSGTTAIGEAYRLIKHGYADAMVAGGSEAIINPIGIAGFESMHALSFSEDPDAASLPFDSRRTGFVPGEGAGVIVLEEYNHAVERGAKIYAILSGYSTTCDAYDITSPDPDVVESSRAICEALYEAGFNKEVEPSKVYVNAHGTGTLVNDPVETKAIARAFSEDYAKKILISSTKSMTGHMLGAAGAVEAIVCIEVLCRGIVPPTANLREPDSSCFLDYVPLQARNADISFSLSNSLGFGGHNACLVFTKN